jgi:Tfp pilus assembly protein PilF
MGRFQIDPVVAARIHLADSNPAAALEVIGTPPRNSTQRVMFFNTKLRALLALSRLEEAAAVANEWIAEDRRTPLPYLFLAREFMKIDMAKAGQFFLKAMERTDGTRIVLMEYADYLVLTGRVAEAQALVSKVDPKDNNQRARIERILSLVAGAAPRQTAIENSEVSAKALAAFAAVDVRPAGDSPEAGAGAVVDAADLRARVLALRARPSELFAFVDNRLYMLADDDDANAYVEGALAARKLKAAQAAVERFNIDPLLAARVHLANAKPDLALALLQRPPADAAALGGYYNSKIRALIALSRLDEATALAKAWGAEDARTPLPYLFLAKAYVKLDPATAEALFTKAAERAPGNPMVQLEYADFLVESGRVADAQQLLRKLPSTDGRYRGRIEKIMALPILGAVRPGGTSDLSVGHPPRSAVGAIPVLQDG